MATLFTGGHEAVLPSLTYRLDIMESAAVVMLVVVRPHVARGTVSLSLALGRHRTAIR